MKLGRRRGGAARLGAIEGTSLGVLALPWRAVVTPDGAVHGPDGGVLAWAVVAEDKVHHPATSSTRRQRTVDGAPVVETAVRVPGGDVVVTAYAVADRGGAVVLAVENRAGTSVAFAVSRADVVAPRPLAAPPAGAPLEPTWRTLPLGHGSALRLALPASGPLTAAELAGLPDAAAVARGWQLQLAAGLHVDLPDPDIEALLRRSRAEACLADVPDPVGSPKAFLLRAATLARLGQLDADDGAAAADVAAAGGELARRYRRSPQVPWAVAAAVEATPAVFEVLGDRRAAADARLVAERLAPAEAAPDEPPAQPARYEAWLTRRLAVASGSRVALLPSFPAAWRGVNLSAYQVPTLAGPVGFAVRWHGARPALLWEAPLGTVVTCPGLDPTWSSTDPSGEALLAAPVD